MINPSDDSTLLATLLEASPDAIVFTDSEGTILQANAAAHRMFGYDDGTMLGHCVDALMPLEVARDHAGFVSEYLQNGIAKIIGTGRELTGRRKGGDIFPLRVSIGHARARDGDYFVAIMHDLTARRNVEAALERSQRMEALGQLTGGVAHDFNNLLTIVSGNVELLAKNPKNKSDAEMLKDVREAAELGTALTAQLLVFSRRGVLMPQDVNVNDVANEMAALLRRTLGPRIVLTTRLADAPWIVETDVAQLQTAILNLAINAKAAMPLGGALLLETSMVSIDDTYIAQEIDILPGEYVRISVSDTGTGMSEPVKNRAFEPFFTTKPGGQGTGLGLAMLYGFARQSGGYATIYSEEGQGTTVSIYLPRKPLTEERSGDVVSTVDSSVKLGNGQLVLVAEDSAAVRRLSVARIEALGYRTLAAKNADQALKLINTRKDIELLFTDIVMPGSMTGYDLAHKVALNFPKMKILLTTAYAGAVPDTKGEIQDGFKLLRKPYRQEDLAATISGMFGG